MYASLGQFRQIVLLPLGQFRQIVLLFPAHRLKALGDNLGKLSYLPFGQFRQIVLPSLGQFGQIVLLGFERGQELALPRLGDDLPLPQDRGQIFDLSCCLHGR